jgi:hypothetical protein
MTAADIIDRLGGSKEVQKLTGLSKGRISQWRTENHIPRPWRQFFESAHPKVFRKERQRQRASA